MTRCTYTSTSGPLYNNLPPSNSYGILLYPRNLRCSFTKIPDAFICRVLDSISSRTLTHPTIDLLYSQYPFPWEAKRKLNVRHSGPQTPAQAHRQAYSTFYVDIFRNAMGAKAKTQEHTSRC